MSARRHGDRGGRSRARAVAAALAAGLAVLLAGAGLAGCAREDDRVVTVLGPWTGAEQRQFEVVVEPFERRTGVEVRYEGARDVDAVLSRLVEEGNPPDLVVLSSPGDLAEYSGRDGLLPLDQALADMRLVDQYGTSWLDLGQIDGARRAIVIKAAVKGLVWYSPGNLPADAPAAPATWADLVRLTDRIRADGGTPWCLGLESSSSSGWPGTDWVESILLRTAGPEVYRQWARGELSWTSPQVRQAWQRWGELVNQPGAVAGGPLGALLTGFDSAGAGLFGEPPRCALEHAGSFIAGFYRALPGGPTPGEDFDFFPLPAEASAGDADGAGRALEVAGDLLGMFRDSQPARELVRHLVSPEAQASWVRQGGTLSANQLVPLDAYPDVVSRKAARLAVEAGEVVFDASDLMPATLQTAFHHAVLAYVSDPSSLDDLLSGLELARLRAY